MPINSHDLNAMNVEFNEMMRLYDRTICETVGWVDDGIDQKEVLHIFQMELVPEDECSQIICVMVPSICIPGKDTPKAEDMGMICARALNETPCAGMGGAPLICGTNVWGIASLLNKCGKKLTHSNYVVFTKLSIAMSMVYTYLGNVTIGGQRATFGGRTFAICTVILHLAASIGWGFSLHS